jgi:glycosyltransferase involved in cell wall biosynthesis
MLVSIIIPSYNHEKYIKRCIDSVLNQSYKNFELIIIDDGSKDSSHQIISSYTDPRIIFVKQENQGAHHAINRGLSMAKGDYLSILNSDDEYHEQRLEKCIQAFHKQPEIDLITTWVDIVDAENKKLGTKEAWKNMEPWVIQNKELTFAGTQDYVLNALMSNFVATTSNMIFKKRVYDKIGGMRNLRFAHDWDFLLRVCAGFKCLNLEESLLNYRIHTTNTISSNRKWMLFEICWVIATHMDSFSARILKSGNEKDISNAAVQLMESINFQGNDKVFWLLYWQINNLRKTGIVNPEEIYLSNEGIRNKIIEYIKE